MLDKNENLQEIKYDYLVLDRPGKISRKIPYKFQPAADPKNSPLLIILHGHNINARPSKFKDSTWNVLCPIDSYGEKSAGSWFLGEKGDFFWLDAIEQLIANIKETSGFTEIYFWGSSMGGFGGILHGIRNGARAVYANIPQIYLLGSLYADKTGMRRYFEPIFADNGDRTYNDLCNFVSEDKKLPLFILSFSRFDKNNYFVDQGMRFINKLLEVNANFYLEVRPVSTHERSHTIAESVLLFDKYLAKDSEAEESVISLA